MSDKPSAAWYLAPIFLGIVGSAIMWYVLKDEEKTMKLLNEVKDLIDKEIPK